MLKCHFTEKDEVSSSSSASSLVEGDASEPIRAQKQTEQESFFSDIFKSGWGSNEKAKNQSDSRETVNEVSANAVCSCKC